MKTLIEKIENYSICVQGLLDKITEYENQVKKEVPGEFWSEFGLKKFGGNQNGVWSCEIDGNMIPEGVSRCGQFTYWAGDFNYGVNFATRAEVVEFAKGLPKLIARLEELFERRIAETESL